MHIAKQIRISGIIKSSCAKVQCKSIGIASIPAIGKRTRMKCLCEADAKVRRSICSSGVHSDGLFNAFFGKPRSNFVIGQNGRAALFGDRFGIGYVIAVCMTCPLFPSDAADE